MARQPRIWVMITVHHLEHSRSQRILWLLEELGLPYEVKRYRRLPSLLAPPELRAVHPLGKSPLIEDSTLAGRVIAETGAIIDYLLTSYGNGRLAPRAGTTDRLGYTYWMYAAEGSAMTPLLLKLITDELPTRSPWLVRPVAAGIARALRQALVTPNLTAHIQLWEDTLGQMPWFAGEAFTAADIMMSFPVEAAADRAGAASMPHIKAWLDTIHRRPAYRRALERGGPYIYSNLFQSRLDGNHDAGRQGGGQDGGGGKPDELFHGGNSWDENTAPVYGPTPCLKTYKTLILPRLYPLRRRVGADIYHGCA